MRVCIITPAPAQSYHGNRVTAMRWQALLSELGHEVEVAEAYAGQACDLLVALHARRSAPSVRRCATDHPETPIVLALTGTDVYPDLQVSGVDLGVLRLARRLVVLQPLAVRQLPEDLRPRTRVLVQSARPAPPGQPTLGAFEVALLAHLRPVKDPFSAAEAARRLPATSAIRILHMGSALEPQLAERARAEMAANPRYRWLGGILLEDALRVLARCRLLVLTSRSEGGANAVSEALAASVPVVSSRIDGSLGLLGDDYPGYFTPGDAEDLAQLFDRVERDVGGLRSELERRCRALRPMVAVEREREAWASLLAELTPAG